MKKIFFLTTFFLLLLMWGCKDTDQDPQNVPDDYTLVQGNGITYRLYKPADGNYKGILVIGSGNNEQNPLEGSVEGASENSLCRKAVENNYLAAIVQYRKTPGTANWNESAKMIQQDYKKCIEDIAQKNGVDKTKSVVAGFSYSSYMLLSANALYDDLNFCQGILAACGATSEWSAQHFKIPIYAVNCSGNNEGDFNGEELFNKIPANSPIKAKSGGITDFSCNTHCGADWTNVLFHQAKIWLE